MGPMLVQGIIAGVGGLAQLANTAIATAPEAKRLKGRISELQNKMETGQWLTPEEQAVLDQGQAKVAQAGAAGQRRAEQTAAAAGSAGSDAATLAGIRRAGQADTGRMQMEQLDLTQRAQAEAALRGQQQLDATQAALSDLRMKRAAQNNKVVGDLAETAGDMAGGLPADGISIAGKKKAAASAAPAAGALGRGAGMYTLPSMARASGPLADPRDAQLSALLASNPSLLPYFEQGLPSALQASAAPSAFKAPPFALPSRLVY